METDGYWNSFVLFNGNSMLYRMSNKGGDIWPASDTQTQYEIPSADSADFPGSA